MKRETATFDAAGGPLSVSLRNEHTNQGQYDLTLLESNEIDIAHRFPRTEFNTTADNTHRLPGASAKHAGRVLDCVVSIGITDPAKAFTVVMELRQDGASIGRVEENGTASGPAHAVELILDLTAPALPKPSKKKKAAGKKTTGKKKKGGA